ncbi:3-oxo-tetronate kinase [Telmatospirillum sp.]|uniref:3-oxo-tetronate kinase n=1 Tax=Telmatospirillum sp. TaxID=2079197 RepID=UPI00284A91FE|nr:3-oxo-tetronate kinase [Telmatospirillum sp.]MDR3438845.1 four-carbon acid sugar kinase family protein [Telmatospirillum sp.]
MAPKLGCIADDFTGGTDLAGMLVKNGLRTVQMIGVPSEPPPPDIDAVVIALKSRTSPVADAVNDSLAALDWLKKAGCQQFYFKYCSTFDSTPAGNIGPVAEALMDALGTDFAIACPAFPANRRTIYKGYLFVGDVPLHESSMQHHPLTPMRESNLVRVLQAQVKRRVGLVDYDVVRKGADAVRGRFDALKREGCGFAIVDAIDDGDLLAIGAACADMPLVTAGSGIAVGLPQNFTGIPLDAALAADLPPIQGLQAVIAGSCSSATLGQVAEMRAKHPAFLVDPLELSKGVDVVGQALSWAAPLLSEGPVMVHATATPTEVKAAQSVIGVERAGALVEEALAAIAKGLVAKGVSRLIVAGGETSGAVVKALGVKGLRIGREIDPGVPWTVALGPDSGARPLALALKSGNFGTPDFFLKAWSHLS